MSLRAVEDALKELDLGVKVSSGHLSLIEQGKVAEPSPRTLHALARAMGLDYITLMVEAGYLDRSTLTRGPTAAPAFRGTDKLDPDEKRQVEDFIDYLATRKRSSRRPKRER